MIAKEYLDKNGFDFSGFEHENEHSAKNLLIAMEEYAKQQAVNFGRWYINKGKDDRLEDRYKIFMEKELTIKP